MNTAPADAIALWGDSTFAGSGQSNPEVTSIAARLKLSAARRPVFNGGIASDKTYANPLTGLPGILPRVQRDQVRGRFWTAVLWMGANNVGDADQVVRTVADTLAAVAAFQTPRVVVMSHLVASDFPIGHPSGYWERTFEIHRQLRLALPNNWLDVWTPLIAGNADGTIPAAKRADSIHQNDAGALEVYNLLAAFLANKGW